MRAQRCRSHQLLLAIGLATSTSCVEETPSNHVELHATQQAILPCVSPPTGGHEIPVRFSIPPTMSYDGAVPVTFGIPFPKGELDDTAFVTLYQVQGGGSCLKPTQVKVTDYWAGTEDVKWLLVDGLVDMVSGEISPVFLHYDNNLAAVCPWPAPACEFPWQTGFASRVAESGQAPTDLDPSAVGNFRMRVSEIAGDFEAEPQSLVRETDGPVRTVYKQTGNYLNDGQRIGEFTTRYTFFRDQEYMRVYHTMVWGRDSVGPGQQPGDEQGFEYTERLEFLAYDVPHLGIGGTCSQVTIGLEGGSDRTSACSNLNVHQKSEESVFESGPSYENQLSGWMSKNISNEQDIFVGLRWAKEQFPSAFEFDGSTATPVVRLLDPRGMAWEELAENGDTEPFDSAGTYLEGPVGVAKTYELWLWPTTGSSAPQPDEKNLFAQGGVFAYADPEFVVRAKVPSPMSACPVSGCASPATPARLATVERAIRDSFTFAISSQTPGDPVEGFSRFGALHFGDIFYDIAHVQNFSPGHDGLSRYWQNTGTGFQVLPWMLWMRSGEREYRDFADANARHVMDVDTVHSNRTLGSGHRKSRGMQGGYDSPHHGAFRFSGEPEGVMAKQSDTEGIVLAYHLTGYERALDVLEERAAGLVASWVSNGQLAALLEDVQVQAQDSNHYGFISDPSTTYGFGDGPQGQYRALAELAILSDLFDAQFPELEAAGRQYLDAIVEMQSLSLNDGWMPGARIAWLEHGLGAVAQAFPDRAVDVRTLLSRISQYGGSPSVPGDTGKVNASPSLFAALARFDELGDERVLRDAQGIVFAQALSVHDDATASVSGWKGSSRAENNNVGPRVREWLAVLATQEDGIAFEPELPPLPYLERAINNRLSVPAHHRYYVPKDAGEQLYLPFDFRIGEFPRRDVSVAVTSPDGTPLATGDYCIQVRQYRFLESVFGTSLQDDISACAYEPSESFVHPLPASSLSAAGVFRVDLSTQVLDEFPDDTLVPPDQEPNPNNLNPPPAEMPDSLSFTASPSVRAIGVTEQENQYLQFSGAPAERVEIAAEPRILGRAKMTVAFRLHTNETSAYRVIIEKPYQYTVVVNSGYMYVYFFYLTGGGGLLSISKPLPSPWTGLNGFVATLFFNEETGEARTRLCTAADDCEESTQWLSGQLNDFAPNLPLTLGRFAGSLDDLRILPRVASGKEISEYFGGNAMYDVFTQEFREGGEAFLFDGDLEGLSGETYSVLHGTAGSDFTFESLPAPSRLGRPRQIVQYDGAQDDRPYDLGDGEDTCCANSAAPNSSWSCAAGAASLQGAGVVVGRREETTEDLAACQGVNDFHPSRFGFLDDAGELSAPSQVSSASPSEFECVTFAGPAGSMRELFLNADRPDQRVNLFGLEPLLARSLEEWFDALACEDHPRAGVFGVDGLLTLPGFSMADDRTISFKMKAPNVPGASTVLNKNYEVLAFTYYNQLHFYHYLAQSGVGLVGNFPVGEWVTVTSTAKVEGGVVRAKLFFNGIEVDDQSASGSFNIAPGFPLTLGGGVTGYGTFAGMLDDVFVRDGVSSPEEVASAWFVCADQVAPPGALAFESFESCPGGSGSFSVVDRLSGTPVDCSGPPLECMP